MAKKAQAEVTVRGNIRRELGVEGVAKPSLLKAPRIEYFERTRNFSGLGRIFEPQEVKNRLYSKKTAKIGLFRPIFVCFYAVSGY